MLGPPSGSSRTESPWAAGRSRRHALIRELILRAPRLGVCCAGVLAQLIHRAGRSGPTPAQLAPLCSRLGRRPLGRLARDIAERSLKSECVGLLKYRRGASRRLRESLLHRDDAPPLSGLRGPTVIATFHAGPPLAVRWALEREAVPILVLAHDQDVEMEAGQRRIGTKEAPASSRAGFIVHAVSFLRRHEKSVVLIAPDAGVAERMIPVEMLGGHISFRPGAAAIARIAGARLIPVLARWETMTRIGIHVGEALPSVETRADELEATRGLARFVEAHFERHPEDLSTFYVSRLAASFDSRSVPSAHSRRSSS